MKKIRYLSIEEAEWFHDRILELTGGERGDLAKANLEFVLERVKGVGEGLDREKAVVKKAAFLLHSLVTHHPFINGNKRTAFEVVDAFLELNGTFSGPTLTRFTVFFPIWQLARRQRRRLRIG